MNDETEAIPRDANEETIANIPAVEMTMPDLRPVTDEDDAPTGRGHRRRGGVPPALIGLSIVGVIVGLFGIGFWVGWAKGSGDATPAPTVTRTKVLPRATVTRGVRTRVLPGPTVTQRLRSHVTVRATVTRPGPTMTVTATPTPTPAPEKGPVQ